MSTLGIVREDDESRFAERERTLRTGDETGSRRAEFLIRGLEYTWLWRYRAIWRGIDVKLWPWHAGPFAALALSDAGRMPIPGMYRGGDIPVPRNLM